MDSLSGNSRIVMIANVSSSILSIEETMNTLKYANRAKNIKIKLKKNVIETEYHISKYDEVITAIRSEIDDLKQQLTKKSSDQNLTETSVASVSQDVVEKVEKMQRDITNHFQEEIKMRKDIIEVERKSENNKIEISEKEYQLYKILNINTKEADELKKQISNLNQEIENNKKIVNEKYGKQSELMKKRSSLQKTITIVTKENPTGGKVLMHTYLYYSTLLDNMNLEHRRNVNSTEVKRKEFQINKLVDQIKARDNFIVISTSEIKMKKIPFKFNTENVKSLEEIDMEPLRLPVVVHNSSSGNITTIKNVDKLRKNNYTAGDNKPQLLLKRNKSPSPTHRSYDYELSLLNKNKDSNNSYLNKFKKSSMYRNQSQENMSSRLEKVTDEDEKIYYVNNNSNISKAKNKRIQIDQKKLELLLNNQNNEDHDRSFEMSNQNNSYLSNRSTSKLEKEMQMKVKTILKKDIIGRYRKSPYLKSFERL